MFLSANVFCSNEPTVPRDSKTKTRKGAILKIGTEEIDGTAVLGIRRGTEACDLGQATEGLGLRNKPMIRERLQRD